jgi:adenylate cyclase class 2
VAHREIETKLPIAALPQLNRRLRALGFAPATPRRLERNQLYDFPDGSLRAGGRLVRLRECGGERRLTVKAPARVRGGIKSRPEHETVIGDFSPLVALFSALGLVPTWYYEKYRREWQHRGVRLFVDETPAGNYLEVEADAGAIRAFAKKLGFSPAQFISDSYFTLYCRLKNSPRPGDMRFGGQRKRARPAPA